MQSASPQSTPPQGASDNRFAPPATLKEFNARLATLGLPRLTKAAFEVLRGRQPRERLVSALARAGSERGAMAWLRQAVGEAAAGASEQPPAGPRDGTAAQPPAAGTPPSPPAQAPATAAPTPDRNPGRPESPPRGRTRQSPDPKTGDAATPRHSMHVYGGKGALCFEADTTRGSGHTLALDAALATGTRQYDWANKVRLQVTRHELPVVTAVLLGYLPRCEFKNHGPGNDKGYSVEDQGGKLFVRVWAKDKGLRAVPVEPEDAFRVAALTLRQLRLDHPWLSGSDLMTLVRAVVGRMKKAPPGPAP